MKIPFVDLKSQYDSIKADIDSAIKSVIENSAFIGGQHVAEFERLFAAAQGAKHCVAVANGTDAIYIALRTIGVQKGDEVITVANSWISTSETITQTGATPVFVDINEFYNIDVSAIESKISDRTKAIIPVHLYGQPADIDRIALICEKNGISLIEDCAQAHLAQFGGASVGNFGVAGTFSFYPGKNLGAYGDAGAIITNDEQFALKCRMFARHGALIKHQHQIEGINSRMDGIQAAILNVKLKHLKNWTRDRQRVASRYSEKLSDISQIKLPEIAPNRSHVFHLFVIRANQRDELQSYLLERDIQTGIHYPTALPFLPCYSYLEHQTDQFPNALEHQSQILSLPIFPEMSEQQIEHVTTCIKDFFA